MVLSRSISSLVWASAMVVAAAQQRPGRPAGTPGFAIVVGISDYTEDSGLAALRFAAKDATDMGRELETQGYRVRTMLNGGATRSLVRRALRDLAASVTAEDQVLFYFSGHGFQERDRNLLATYGVTADDIGSDGLPLEEVMAVLDSLRARGTAAMIDACRSQPLRGAKAGITPTFQSLPRTANTLVLYSTSPSQASFEDERQSQGVFTRFVLQGLRGGAANADGVVTFNGLASYVQSSVRTAAFESGKRQTPVYAGPQSGDFVVATRGASPRRQSPEERQPVVDNYRVSRRFRFGSDRFLIAFDSNHWQPVGEISSDRVEFALNNSRLSAVLTHETVQSSYQRLLQKAVESLGGPAVARVVEDGRVTQGSSAFYRAVLSKGANRYVYFFYTGEPGTLSAVVYGPGSDPAWANGIGERLLRDISLVR